jgi:phosphoglycolate phosphatase-like HAD superfamily hydrolase
MSIMQSAVPLPYPSATPRRSDRFNQADVLRAALQRLTGPHTIAVFDLDSTLLDNRPRQARIVREFGLSIGDKRLQDCQPIHWEGWEIETPLKRCGLSSDEVAQLAPQAKQFWRERFFTSAYCGDDLPNAGAANYLARVTASEATICYVTGRHTEMGRGSEESFERAGFPRPDGARVHLLLKPKFETADDEWKVIARDRLRQLGSVVCAFDNEPSHINSYRVGFPECYSVHLDTDHSGRPIELLPDIPSVRDFVF